MEIIIVKVFSFGREEICFLGPHQFLLIGQILTSRSQMTSMFLFLFLHIYIIVHFIRFSSTIYYYMHNLSVITSIFHDYFSNT